MEDGKLSGNLSNYSTTFTNTTSTNNNNTNITVILMQRHINRWFLLNYFHHQLLYLPSSMMSLCFAATFHPPCPLLTLSLPHCIVRSAKKLTFGIWERKVNKASPFYILIVLFNEMLIQDTFIQQVCSSKASNKTY
jgi:hypothetical protein